MVGTKNKSYDVEKLKDLKKLSKEDFLESYSYLNEKDYKELLEDLKMYERINNL